VYKVIRKSNNLPYALKKVKLDNLKKKEKQNALTEVRILASIRHPNIITYKESFLDEDTNSLWYEMCCLISFYLSIIMEYANDGDLLTRIKL